MKEKKLLRALGNVDNQYIKEAEPMKKTSKITNRQKWVSVAACFVLVVVIGVGVFQSNLSNYRLHTQISTQYSLPASPAVHNYTPFASPFQLHN